MLFIGKNFSLTKKIFVSVNARMYKEFLKIAEKLNNIGIVPLLFGSLGLEQRLDTPLNPDDIDE